MKLNLGCGEDYREGYVNIDIDPDSKVDLVHDLSKKLPFKDDSVTEIIAYSVLEHLESYSFIIKEMYRVCQPHAIIKVIVPHFSSTNAFHSDHKRFYTANSSFIEYSTHAKYLKMLQQNLTKLTQKLKNEIDKEKKSEIEGLIVKSKLAISSTREIAYGLPRVSPKKKWSEPWDQPYTSNSQLLFDIRENIAKLIEKTNMVLKKVDKDEN